MRPKPSWKFDASSNSPYLQTYKELVYQLRRRFDRRPQHARCAANTLEHNPNIGFLRRHAAAVAQIGSWVRLSAAGGTLTLSVGERVSRSGTELQATGGQAPLWRG